MLSRSRATTTVRTRTPLLALAVVMVGLPLDGPVGAEALAGRLEATAPQAGIDLTGEWGNFCPQCPPWQLTQSGNTVTARWRGGPPGHEGIVGEFTGNLTGQRVVEGSIRIAEGSVRVTGTMRMTVRSADELALEWTQSNGYKGNATLRRAAAHRYEPVRVDIRYHANNLPTTPPADGASCPEPQVEARITGTIMARITEQTFEHQGSGDAAARPHLNRCRVPVINLQVDKVELRVLTPGRVLQATLSVRITQEGVHRPGDCRVGTRGTIVATFDETATAANSLPNHSLQFGPWENPCTAHTQTITNNISSIAADASSSTWVRVWIACKGEGTGFAPKFCT